MMISPLFFCVFLIYYPSGLALYIVASYLVGMAQQWYLNRTMPVAVKASRGRGGKKD
jgi:membrane protein insertase Oxa1/YidC/SpoIIIJ